MPECDAVTAAEVPHADNMSCSLEMVNSDDTRKVKKESQRNLSQKRQLN